MVYRVYVEKKKEHAFEARGLMNDITSFLGISGLTGIRVLNRYDAEDISKETFDRAVGLVFSEPQVDTVAYELETGDGTAFAVEYLPGQFDQRADSAEQCIQILTAGERPLIRSAKVYILYGNLTEDEISEIKKYVINPVEAREADLAECETLKIRYDIPTTVDTLEGFRELDRDGLSDFVKKYGLAADVEDMAFAQEYFINEKRDPTITEIRMIDTYWSDHCRHTTFLTEIDDIKFEDELLEKAYEDYMKVRQELGRTKPVCLMDIGTIAAKYLKSRGKLDKLDESEEINACTVKVEIEVDGKKEPWLLLFKNETHNHPTEIEPFGGAATCIGGAIRDPLSGRSYVYGAMRITGGADPTAPVSETIPGKLPQRKLLSTAAAGYSSYGNQIGLATGIVDEIYHPGYAAKHMEIGAVIAAAPAENVRREVPSDGDIVILLGGDTGRDGIGGATGSSKAHDSHSVETCGAEVQKGNAPEERKLQRLFRNKEACLMIKRCNDFGAGGVSVAIGELADGLEINLDAVPKKYDGLDGTELAISESQERMAVVIEPWNLDKFLELAESENLKATPVAVVKAEPRLVMNWNGKKIVDISREFLNSNGAEKHITISTAKQRVYPRAVCGGFTQKYKTIAADLNICSKRGLAERFDSTIGAVAVLAPFGGKYQLTPTQCMAQKISVEKKHTDDCSVMSWGYNPVITETSPYHGAYLAVVESVCKLVASGAKFEDVYLTFQEYFEKPGNVPERWGKPLSALLGAFEAQIRLGVAAIGGKDSMSGSFEDLDVPPTLVSFAVTTEKAENIVSPEFKKAGSKVVIFNPLYDRDGLPDTESLIRTFDRVTALMREGKIISCYTPGPGGIAEAIMKMGFGNGIGFRYCDDMDLFKLFDYSYASFIAEAADDLDEGVLLGETTDDGKITYREESIELEELLSVYEGKLEGVYPCNIENGGSPARNLTYRTDVNISAGIKAPAPKVVIPAFPGTNCEYDSAKAFADAGAEPEIIVVNNLTSEGIKRSVERFAKSVHDAHIIFIPGGFSGGDEPDGSGKFITAFFRNQQIKDEVTALLDEREGLMLGICNGFQALVKLGLVPYGKIIDTTENDPTLTFNVIARHQSRIVRTRIASNKSPWFALADPDAVYSVPISHGEGRFVASEEDVRKLSENGQIATQYVDLEGNATMDVHFNPNGSTCAIEGILSPDGRVLGKMGHSERIGSGLYKNVPGEYDMKLFASAVKYFR